MENSYTDPQKGLDRLLYLRDHVFPHLAEMPTIEEFTDEMKVTRPDEVYDNPEIEFYCNGDTGNGRRALQGKAVLDFNVYRENNTVPGFDQLPVSDEYNCSRQGCLAGWYTFMRDEDTRKGKAVEDFNDQDRCLLDGYSVMSLTDHFQISGGQAQMLFGSLLKGAEGLPDELDTEATIWSTSQLNVTKVALETRRDYLNQVIEEKEMWMEGLAALV